MAQVINRVCLLKPLEAEHHNIQLEAGKNIIGRSRETNIRDVRCAKQQLQLDVDLKAFSVKMKVLGLNPSSVNGIMSLQNSECTLQHGDLIEIVYGRHAYEVVFKPPPATKPVTENPTDDPQTQKADAWQTVNDEEVLIFTSKGVRPSEKIAAYDMDWTLIKTRSGNVFPRNHDDWELLYPNIPKKLKMLYDDGFKICIFSNQGGIGRGKVPTVEFQNKVKAVVQKLNVPVQFFAATQQGHYRKPLTGMWLHMRDELNHQVPLKLEKCFYVGDAAGRDESGRGVSKRRKDHSLVDRLFAKNIGISFYTPEVHFLGQTDEPWQQPSFEPKSLNKNTALLDPADTELPSSTTELIVMVGLPGAGKSHFCKTHLATLGYKIANGDALGGTTKCLSLCDRTLASKQSCVVDQTNVSVEARAKFIELAKKHGVPCRCFVMNLTPAHAKHNITYRELTDSSHAKINEMTLNGMKKRYLHPTLAEGFDAIVKVNFKPKFENEQAQQLYEMHLLDK